jgi:LmbE family N-acetylglucosaminyl deacetylase
MDNYEGGRMKRILLISAHPDDMEIGMGGTAAKFVAAGNSLLSVVITDGRRSPDPEGIGQDAMARLRQEEGVKACQRLGINETNFLGFESIISDEAVAQATGKLVEVINDFQPDEIYTLHPELDRHASHRAAGKITVDALNQSNSVAELWAYEVWGLFSHWDRLDDISDQLETKLAAIREHSSQTAAIQYDEGIAGLNRWRGVFADPHQEKSPASYAEVFIKLR